MAILPAKKLRLPVQQLIILSICRFAEPVALTSVFPYLPEMIESFDIPTDDVAQWAGITSAVFSFSQCLTGIAWGRASDYFGRKRTILVGLTCTMTACLMFGFSRSLTWAIVARSMAGASSGTVGIIRTTVAEMVPERELQPKAFSIMPLIWGMGSIAGPILGGALANPADNLPAIFGDVYFFREFPFSLPNLVASLFFVVGIISGFLFLKETLETRRHDRDNGRVLGQLLVRTCSSRRNAMGRKETWNSSDAPYSVTKGPPPAPPRYREVFSYQSNLNLFTYTLLALHAVAYDQLIAVFLHTPFRKEPWDASKGLKFAGGFGLSTSRIGLLLTMYGIVSMFLQFLVFPPAARKYGTLNCLRVMTFLYPFIYIATPFAVLLPTDTSRQIVIFVIMLFKCLAGIFSFPCTTILLTNSAGSLRLLGTLNGVATSISAAGRGLGPFIVGNLFTWSLKIDHVVIAWWALAFFAVLGHIPTWWLEEKEGFSSSAEDDLDDHEDEIRDHEESIELLAVPAYSRTTAGADLAKKAVTHDVVYRSNTGAEQTGADDTYHDNEELDQSRPLLSTSVDYDQAKLTPLAKTNSQSSKRSSSLRRTMSNTLAAPIDFLEHDDNDVSTAPIGMGQIAHKGRHLSTNIVLSDGLGLTEAGSGFGTSGSGLGTGYDRSRSVSRRREERSVSRSRFA